MTCTEAASRFAKYMPEQGMPFEVANFRSKHVEAFISYLQDSCRNPLPSVEREIAPFTDGVKARTAGMTFVEIQNAVGAEIPEPCIPSTNGRIFLFRFLVAWIASHRLKNPGPKTQGIRRITHLWAKA